MFKHSLVYSVMEDYLEIDKETKSKIKKFKMYKDKNIPSMNLNNFWNVEEKEKLKNLLNLKFKKLCLKYNFKVKDCWIQKYLKNSYHSLHTHSFDKQSFVWFIEGSEKSSPIKFFDVGWPLINTNQFIEIPFKPGTFLIFPGFLPHEVQVNNSHNRLIVSGNVI